MSVESLTVALHHSRAKGTARLVLLGIANHDGDGGSWPSIATLAKYAGGVDVRNVQRALTKLVELGEIEPPQVQRGGTADTPDATRPNRYVVTLTCPFDCDRTTQHRTSRQLRLVTPVSDVRSDRVALAPGGGAGAGGGVALAPGEGVAPAPPEPSIEPTMNTGLPTSPQSQRRPVDNARPEHSCDGGWLDEQADGKRAPCLLCKPHLARRRRAGAL